MTAANETIEPQAAPTETAFSTPESQRIPVTEVVCRLCFSLYRDFRDCQRDFMEVGERVVMS